MKELPMCKCVEQGKVVERKDDAFKEGNGNTER